MRIIICGCEQKHMEYILTALGLIAKRDHRHLTVMAPDRHERKDDMCRYITIGEDIHTDIGKGMADALVVYRYSSGIRRIENLKNEGKLILVRESPVHPGLYVHSPSAMKAADYLGNLLYLKSDAVIIERNQKVNRLFEFYTEEEILRLLELR